MLGAALDARRRLLEVEEGPAARRAGDELRPRGAQPRPLEDAIGELDGARRIVEARQGDRIADAVAQRRAEVDRGGDQRRLVPVARVASVAQDDGDFRAAASAQAGGDEPDRVHRQLGVRRHQNVFQAGGGARGERAIERVR